MVPKEEALDAVVSRRLSRRLCGLDGSAEGQLLKLVGWDEEKAFRGLLAFSAVHASWFYTLGSGKSCFKTWMFLLRF